MFALFLEFGARTRPQDLRPIFFTETGLKFLTLWTQGEIGSGNRAHVKSPKSWSFFHMIATIPEEIV